jgi:hypothetical protein
MKIDQKLKKEIEIYIRKNSKKILRGYFDGKNGERIQTKNVSRQEIKKNYRGIWKFCKGILQQ